MNLRDYILAGVTILLAGAVSASCVKEINHRTEPAVDVASTIEIDPDAGSHSIELTSTYPWYAESSQSWIKITKNRGQALLKEKIIFETEYNNSFDERNGVIKIMLMDQLEVSVLVKQLGNGECITVVEPVIVLNNEAKKYVVDVHTQADWTLTVKEKDGISFENDSNNKLIVNVSANDTGKDREVVTELVNTKNDKRRASFKIIQKSEKSILAIVLPDDQKACTVGTKDGFEVNVPIVLDKKFTLTSDQDWLKIDNIPEISNFNKVSSFDVTLKADANETHMERNAIVTLKGDDGSSDQMMVSQRGVSKIIYCKAGSTGVTGTSWNEALGDFSKALSQFSDNDDTELWVSGDFDVHGKQIIKYVNIFGGFTGNESCVAQRDLTKKSVLRCDTKIAGYGSGAPRDYYLDGFVITGINSTSQDVGTIEFYKNHVLRNCVVCGNTFGKNAGGYYDHTKIINCVFYNNTNTASAGVVQVGPGSQMINCTVVNNKNTGEWGAAGGLRMSPGATLINSVVWGNVQESKGRNFKVQVYLDKDNTANITNSFIMGGVDNNGNEIMFNDGCKPVGNTGFTKLGSDNANGPKFNNPAENDYSLMSGSPLIDAGKDQYVTENNTFVDFLGKLRLIGSHVDVGAIEFQK